MKHHCYEKFSRAICYNISYKIDIGHTQNSGREQKKLPTIFFCAVQPINNLKKKKNSCSRQSFRTDLENVTDSATLAGGLKCRIYFGKSLKKSVSAFNTLCHTVMQIEKALISDHLLISDVS